MLEDAIIHYGNVVSFEQLAALSGVQRAYTRKRVSRLVQQGWLARLKKGVYSLADLGSRGSVSLSQYVVAQLLVTDSYVSFEAALQYHGWYDQLLQTMMSVALIQHKATTIDGYTYQFVKTKDAFFYGWEQQLVDQREVKIATTEKALLDLIMFHRTTYIVDLVVETLQTYQRELDNVRLISYLGQSTVTVQRIFGFLFDLVGLEAQPIQALVAGTKGTSKLTRESTMFCSKWRLYYEPYFCKYQTVIH
ncbi:MAG: type IV toxin-antitoxin system AbiEi family antitoxin domain-containing protein [Caldilineaceae bacterium]